jgi:hypothetical protein
MAIGYYIWAAFWGALTTATRSPGVALIPAFFLVAWREKRPPLAYVAGFASAIGFFSFIAVLKKVRYALCLCPMPTEPTEATEATEASRTSYESSKGYIAVLKKVRYAHGGLCPRRPMPTEAYAQSYLI